MLVAGVGDGVRLGAADSPGRGMPRTLGVGAGYQGGGFASSGRGLAFAAGSGSAEPTSDGRGLSDGDISTLGPPASTPPPGVPTAIALVAVACAASCRRRRRQVGERECR